MLMPSTFINEMGWDPFECSLPEHLNRMMELFKLFSDKGMIIPDFISASCLFVVNVSNTIAEN
jgi:hypothetical protein